MIKVSNTSSSLHCVFYRMAALKHPIRSQDVRNAMAVSTSYNVLVSVVNPDPAAITLDYDLVQGTKLFLEPFLSQLGSELGAVSYQTQVIRYVTLPTKPFKTGDKYYIIEVRHISRNYKRFKSINLLYDLLS